jgi:homoserine O-acetyltransferase
MTAALVVRPPPAAEDIIVPLPRGYRLQSGDVLADAHVQLRRYGAWRGPVVLALGGISSGRFVCGEGGWWSDVVAPGGGVDTERFSVVGADFAPLSDQRVRLTPHDHTKLLKFALDDAGIAHLHAFVGASYGGMVGLAFASLYPKNLERLCVISAAHRPSAQAAAWRGVQRRIVEYGLQNGDGAGGLALARQLAMITYRSADEFEDRFGAGVADDGLAPVDRYLIARGEAYAGGFAPRRWLSLSEAIDRFAVHPASVSVPTTLIACASDQLVPLAEMQKFAGGLPFLSRFEIISSLYGHDAFLKEPGQIGAILRAALEGAAP